MNRDLIHFAGLAHRRYPDMPLELAVMCLESDRRAAGLGALDEKRRLGRSCARNSKRQDLLTGRVIYSRVIDIPPRDERPVFDFDWNMLPGSAAATATVTVTRHPARFDHKALQVEARDLQDQSGRTIIARQLRELRRQTRAS